MSQDPASPQDNDKNPYSWVKVIPLTPEEQALQDKLQTQAAQYDSILRNGKPYEHPAAPGATGYTLPEGADYRVEEMGPPRVFIVSDDNTYRAAYTPLLPDPSGGGGVILMGRGMAKDPDLVDFTLAHETAHRHVRNENLADLDAAKLVGPQKAIDALGKLGEKLTGENRIYNFTSSASMQAEIEKIRTQFELIGLGGKELEQMLEKMRDPHDSIPERQQHIIDAFPDQDLKISDSDAALAAVMEKFLGGRPLEVVGTLNGGALPATLEPVTPSLSPVAPGTGMKPDFQP